VGKRPTGTLSGGNPVGCRHSSHRGFAGFDGFVTDFHILSVISAANVWNFLFLRHEIKDCRHTLAVVC
jgi:hypothetical protein